MRKDHPYKNVFRAVAVIAIIIGLLSAVVNGWFGWMTGKNTDFIGWVHWGYVAATGSALFDILKDFLPILIVMALTRKGWDWRLRMIAIVAPAALWVPLAYNSWTYASGAAVLIQSNTAGAHSSEVDDKRTLLNEKKSLTTKKNGWTTEVKEPTALEEEIQAHLLDKRWKATAKCASVSDDYERSYCKQYHKLVADKKNAEAQIEAQAKTNDRLAKIEEKLAGLTTVLVMPETSGLPVEDEETRAHKAERWAFLLESIPTGLPAVLYVFAVLLAAERKDEEAAIAVAAAAPVVAPHVKVAPKPKIILTGPITEKAVQEVAKTEEKAPKLKPSPRKALGTGVAAAPVSEGVVSEDVIAKTVSGLVGRVAVSQIVTAIADAGGGTVHPKTLSAYLAKQKNIQKLPDRTPINGVRQTWYQVKGAPKLVQRSA